MRSQIQTLPSEVVDLIAAGEVIDSLAAVVRELAENALDAGATRLIISIYPEFWRVRVADNGGGMNWDDLQQAALPHSTSKIRYCEDLWKITSLGFRGEALHSLAALADLEILSRPIGDVNGWGVTYNSQGEAVKVETQAIASGTVVTVSNLFGTWTSRRQGLPALSQQLRLVQSTIHQIALCHPQVTWKIEQNDRPWFHISPGVTAQQILPQILREVRLSDLQYWGMGSGEWGMGNGEWGLGDQQQKAESDQLEIRNSSLELVLGLPDRCHRHRPDWIKVAVNGRIVKSPGLEQTILTAFHRTLPRDRYPVCFVHLKISPTEIDWNRHPAKAIIYLHKLSYWQEQITAAIVQSLRISPANLSDFSHSQRVEKLIKASEDKATYNLNRTIEITPSQDTQKAEVGLIELKAIAQVHQTYIIAEYSGGIWLIEQHIAHERVLYEQLCNAWQIISIQPPIILHNLSTNQRSQLERIGLEIEPFGEQLWAIRSAPALLATREDCAEALLELSLGGDLQAAQVATACRSAIRNGTNLNLQEMQTLLNQWKCTRNPHTCPHGRPIYLSLQESALARFFRRNWVIGKSHGISN